MSYKLLIVDDEPIVCNGLKKFVNWEELSFHTVYTAHSVAQALVILEQQTIDVVMTDIRMPIQTGLDLLRILNTDFPSIKTLILSGHSDFEYAREALRLGALDFITKPVNFDELKKTFSKILDKLKHDQSHHYSSTYTMQLEQDTLLNNLILGDLGLLNSSKFQHLGLSSDKNFLIFRIYLDIPTKHYEQLHALKSELSPPLLTAFSYYGETYLFNHALQEIECLFYPLKVMSFDKLCHHLEETLTAFCKEISFSVGISPTHTHLHKLKDAHQEAGKALQYRIMKPVSFIRYEEIDSILSYKLLSFDQFKPELIEYLNTGNIAALHLILDSMFHPTTPITTNETYSLAIDFMLFLQEYTKHLHEDLADSPALRQNIRYLLLLPTREDVYDYIKNYVNGLITLLSTQTLAYGNLIQTALLYIEEHYSENITLLTLSEFLYLHPTYLSRLFKEKTGKNFLRYLTDLRIEKSKVLLADFSLKIYDISNMVGYDSSKYFSKIFKASTGITPREYRDSLVPQ